MRSVATGECRQMPSAWPSSWVVVSARHAGRPGAFGSESRVDVHPNRKPELGVVVADVQVRGAGALRRQRAVQPGPRELDPGRRARAHDHVGRAESLTIVASNSWYRNAARQAAMAWGTFSRQAGGVLHPDPDGKPALRPVEAETVVARAAHRGHDEPPLVEIVPDRRGDVAARGGGDDQRRRRSSGGAAHRAVLRRQADRQRDPAHALGLREAAALELVGREAVEVVAQRGHEVPLGQHRPAVVYARARQEPQRAAVAEDALLVRRPVLMPPGADVPPEPPVERARRAEHEGAVRRVPRSVLLPHSRLWNLPEASVPRARPDSLAPDGSEAPSASIGAIDWRTVISSTITSRSRLLAPIAPRRA